MLWLQRPPWAKWIAVGLISALALWLEVRPDPEVEYPFAAIDIAPGEAIGPHNTEKRPLPAGVLDPPPEGVYALEVIPAGTPVLEADIGSGQAVLPEDWWIVSVDVPTGAAVGDLVQVVLLDSGKSVDGIVASISTEDPFSPARGGVAVEAASSTEVAVAAANGRVAILFSTSGPVR